MELNIKIEIIKQLHIQRNLASELQVSILDYLNWNIKQIIAYQLYMD